MNRTHIPSQTTQRAHTAAGFVSRIATALNTSSTFAGLSAAEIARTRAIDELRALGPEIRRLKQEAKRNEAEKPRAVSGFEIPA